jgi:hypothetical protein
MGIIICESDSFSGKRRVSPVLPNRTDRAEETPF